MAAFARGGWRVARRKAGMSLLAMVVWLMLGLASAHADNTVTKVTLVVTDPQGNVLMTTDTQGHILARYTYRPYGTQQSGPTNRGPGYTGHVNDPDTGLVYMQQRYYDPAVGRFISPDPVGPTPGNIFNFGRYTYANNNPLRYTDPDGRRIRLANLGDSALVEKLIGTLASGSFKVNKSGYLTYQIKPSANGGKSTYYSGRLMSAIDSKKVIVVHVASTFKSPITHKMENVDSQDGGGATLKTSVGGKHTKAAVFVSGNAYNGLEGANGKHIKDSAAVILAHELVGHAIPFIIGGGTGNAVRDENEVRYQNDLKKRKPDPDHTE